MTDIVVGGTFIEVMRASVASLRVGQVVIEIMRTTSASPLRVGLVVVEVMRSSMIPPPGSGSLKFNRILSINT